MDRLSNDASSRFGVASPVCGSRFDTSQVVLVENLGGAGFRPSGSRDRVISGTGKPTPTVRGSFSPDAARSTGTVV